MELRQIIAFTTLADTLNFTRAADMLYITQPTLSKQISSLERELNVKLLVRDTHAVLLTERGAAFLKEARKIIADVDRAIDAAKGGEEKRKKDQLIIGFEEWLSLTASTTGAYMKLFNDFHQRHPDVEVLIRKYNFTGLIHALQKDEIDIAFMLHEGLINKSYLDTFLDLKFDKKLIYSDELVFLLQSREGEDYSRYELRELLALYPTAFLSRHYASSYTASEVFKEIGVFPFVRFFDDWTEILMRISMGEGFTICPKEHCRLMNIGNIIGVSYSNGDFSAYVMAHWSKNNANPYIRSFTDHASDNRTFSVLGDFI